MKRKLLALLLALVMVLSLLPAALVPDTAVADGNNGYLAEETVQGGAILHCFDWSYNEIKAALPDIKAAGYVAVQTSPVQPPKDYNAEWTDGNQWWKLYQPLGFTIADGDTWLGTKAELTELCTVAEDQYGIKVIVDVVANHLANKTGGGGWEQVNENIDPDLYYPEYFHTNTEGVNDSSRAAMTQNQMGMPDLNTANEFVQQKVYDLLVECVDCGVDGFRFDAAKHIELPGDTDCGSDFWPTILNGDDDEKLIEGIRPYAGENNLFIYGESLSGNAGETWVDEYTSYMALTDSDYGGRIRSAIGGTNAGMLGDGRYVRCEDARGNVVWVESHDTYEDGGSVWLTDDQIIKAWAIVGARADSTALYFARPNEIMGKASSDDTWKSTAVAEVNKFKNRYDGMSEYMHSDYNSKVAWVERGGNGVVISKLDGAGSVLLSVHQMANGTYTDQITGNIFTVSNGMIRGTVGITGVAVVYDSTKNAQDANPETPTYDYIRTSPLYLIPNEGWKSEGARFAMYVCTPDGSDSAWVDMTDADGDGIYEAQLPGGYWNKVIFCRMNGSTTENNWDNKWNQTGDLITGFTGNCYIITGWDYSGTWSDFNPYEGFYLVGNMNGWAINSNYKLKLNTGSATEEYWINCDLSTFSRCKVAHSTDGLTVDQENGWYPDSEENSKDFGAKGEITKNGNYNIYFRKDGNNDWSYKYINAVLQSETPASDKEGFYLVGTMTNWQVKSDYKLTKEDGVYTIDKHLSVMDQLKVVYSVDGTETSIWYPDPSPNYGADDATRIIGSGVYHISFRPNYDGGSGWFNNCIKVSGCPVIVNIVGNSDLIEWTLYKSENGNKDEWNGFGGDEEDVENWNPLENGDNVVPVGWEVGLEAKTKDNNAVKYDCEISYTDDEGCAIGVRSGDTNSKFRASVGPLGEGPVIITLTVNPNPTFKTQSLTLGGEIGVNFYMDLSKLTDAEKASSYMTFEVGTENKKVVSKAVYDATKTGENGTYGFTCYVNAIEMADDIKPVFHYKLSGDSEEKTVVRSAYSVRLYVVESLNPETLPQPDATTAALEKKLIEYGHYVQLYLQKLRGWAFGTDYTKIEPYDDGVSPYYSTSYDAIKAELAGQGHAITRTIHNNSVIEKITYSLVLDSKTTIRVYIKPAAGYNGEITVDVDGAATIATKLNDGRYLVEIKGIGAHELGETYTIDINNGAASVEVSAMSYVLGMLENEDATNVAKDAVCSIYYYWKAALNYLSAHQS